MMLNKRPPMMPPIPGRQSATGDPNPGAPAMSGTPAPPPATEAVREPVAPEPAPEQEIFALGEEFGLSPEDTRDFVARLFVLLQSKVGGVEPAI